MTEDKMTPQERDRLVDRAVRWIERQHRWETEHSKVAPLPARTATKPTPAPEPPTRPGVRITLTADAPAPSAASDLWRSRPERVTSTDARDTDADAPCWACGGPVQAEGATYQGAWRVHPGCEALIGYEPARVRAAARALAVGDLDLVDAALVACRVLPYAERAEQTEPTWTTEPLRVRMRWRHVDRKALRAAVAALPARRVAAGLDPGRCRDGGCGWCGTASSTGWVAVGLTWSDGSLAPLCEACYSAWQRHSEPQYPDDVRRALAARLTGVAAQAGYEPPETLRPYLDTATGDHAGGEPWAHLSPVAVQAYRLETWSRYGGAYAPQEHREEVAAYLAEQEQQRAARAAEQAVEQAKRADSYGF
jgi:hypothetical protein